MTTTSNTSVTTQVSRVYIRATPEPVWDAITEPEWTERYGHGGVPSSTCVRAPRTGGLTNQAMRSTGAPDVGVDGEVIEVDPPRKLVQT